MSYLAPPPPPSAFISRHTQAGPAYGAGGSYAMIPGMHGRELSVVLNTVHRVIQRNTELGKAIVANAPDGDFSYKAVPPARTYTANVIFVQGKRIAPLPLAFDFDEE